MKQGIFELQSVNQITRDIFELKLTGDASEIKNPGEFVNILLPNQFLRRPISICDYTRDYIILLVKSVGAGTRELVRYNPGTRLDILTGLGNGFQIPSENSPSGKLPDDLSRVILAGGGIGIAPLYALAKKIIKYNIKYQPVIAMGFQSAEDLFYIDKFRELGCHIQVATADGSAGIRGLVTDILKQYPERNYIYACGPSAMLKAIYAIKSITGGQFSFEARMGCGFGACMGCSMPVKDGYKRVCKDGPVFFREEIIF